jgi:8-oxo-dGTP pyrophosphatase MutT (NUDIX family)
MAVAPDPKADLPIQLAATVVPLRPAAGAPEVLLLQRAAALAFYAGAWVFPGGRIDPEDGDTQHDLVEVGKRAAVRELAEEAGLTVAPDALQLISRWVTPPGRTRRFDTFHFMAQVSPDQPVRVQESEVAAYRWLTAAEALRLHAQAEIELPPPTFVTLTLLAALAATSSIEDIFSALSSQPLHYVPRQHVVDGGFIYLYAPDAGYESGELTAPGVRHRLHVFGREWRYER